MSKPLLFVLFLTAFSSPAQTPPPMQVPATAVPQLEELKELTKRQVLSGAPADRPAGRLHVEVNPELNRWLVVATDDFVRVTKEGPSAAAYLACMDRGLARLAPLMHDDEERQQVAEFYQELMDMVGLESSAGRLTAFMVSPGVYPFPAPADDVAVLPAPVAPAPALAAGGRQPSPPKPAPKGTPELVAKPKPKPTAQPRLAAKPKPAAKPQAGNVALARPAPARKAGPVAKAPPAPAAKPGPKTPVRPVGVRP